MQSQSQYEQVVACIKKPPLQRTTAEARILYPWLVNKSELFKSLKQEVVTDIIKNCEFAEKRRDSVIIRQGDKGDRFYVILSGKVSVYINTEAVPDDPEEASVVVTEGPDSRESSDVTGKKKELDRNLYGNYIASIDAGKSFGELALISKDCVRNASIIADELTHLLVVDRDLYNRSLRAAQEAEFQQRIDFVNRCSLFNNWPIRFKRQAAMSLRKENLVFDMPVVRQGDPVNGLVFILSGQAKVVVDIMMHYHQFPHFNLHEDPEDLEKREFFGDAADLGQDTRSDSSRKLWTKPIRRQGYAVAESRQAQRHLEVSLIGPGEVLGDIEQGLDLSTYAQSVVCTEPSEVYILDSKNYERLVLHRRNPGTLSMLRKKAEMKVLSRMMRPLDRQIPLIRSLSFRIVEAHRQHEEAIKAQGRSPSPNHLTGLLGETVIGSQSSLESFIPQRGPLIDHYGPGTVFYRNKMKRLQKIKAQKLKEQTVLEAKGGNRRIVGTVYGVQTNDPEDPAKTVVEKQAQIEEHDEEMSDDDVDLKKKHMRHPANRSADWETSEDHLIQLEERINGWLMMANAQSLSHKNGVKPVAKLARFRKEDKKKIFPGKKIYLRPRKQANPPSTKMNHVESTNIDHPARKRSGSDQEEDGEDNVFITESRVPSSPRPDAQGRRQNSHASPQNGEEHPIFDGLLQSLTHHRRPISVVGNPQIADQRVTPVHKPYRSKTRFLPLSSLQAKTASYCQAEGHRQNQQPHHQYTAEDYKALKSLMLKKQKELNAFRLSVQIF